MESLPEVEARLDYINKLKSKYGNSIVKINSYKGKSIISRKSFRQK